MSPALLAAVGAIVTVTAGRVALGLTGEAAVRARLAALGPAGQRWSAGPWRTPWRRAGEQRRVVRELPDALEDVARSLRSGTSLRVALGEAAGAERTGARGDLAIVVEWAQRGEPLGTALDAWARWRPLPEVRLAVAALGLGLEAGAASARTVDGLALTLRERAAVVGEVHAQAAQARLSALVIAALPVAFTTWTCLTDRRIATFLFATPAGWGCLLGGITLNAIGIMWMRRITRSAL